MKKRKAIKDERYNKPTSYCPAGKCKVIAGIGEFPSLINNIWEEDGEVDTTYKLAVITSDFIYYVDEKEGDDTSGVVMLNRKLKLVSDNFLAANDLFGIVQTNDGLLWMSKTIKDWQKRDFAKVSLISNKWKRTLQNIDVQKLSEKEKTIYFAYRKNGPVKYSKPQSLMAVMSNDLDQDKYSDQLSAIMKILPRE